MDSKVIILFLVLGSALEILAKYRKNGDHFGNEEDSLSDFTEYTNTMIHEWEELISQQDAEDIARKYSIDVVWIHPTLGMIETREDVKQAYEALFSVGATSVKVTRLGSSNLGDNYAYLLETMDWLDKDGNTILVTEALIIFRQLKEGGFQVLFKSEAYVD